MNKKDDKFVPFIHENLELKNQLIEWARSLKNKLEPEAQLASVMIYANFTEYLAEHLLETMRYIIYQGSYNQFAGIVFINNDVDTKPVFMRDKLKELSKYEFPDKKQLLTMFTQINKKRNNLFHNLAKADQDQLSEFDSDMQKIQEQTEELFAKINTIYAGLQQILYGVEAKTKEKAEKNEG